MGLAKTQSRYKINLIDYSGNWVHVIFLNASNLESCRCLYFFLSHLNCCYSCS
uniref:Uncharacterized protein n=1 Tax=Utricularia reniformis TaxID=192314 RepID=A0A1Y0B435_9LAMI|nr:hypothetical protein AEK19_MT2058 [Utricularia reniformis]ART32215.1 hypothetical protein AEK19_MT2058 [Utricularia reniformis]